MRTILLTGICALVFTAACSKNNNASSQNTQSDRAVLSDLATRMVDDARQARASIHNQDKQTALNRINDALAAMKDIQHRAPKQSEIPVYQEIETVTVWQPQEIVEDHSTAKIPLPTEGTRARTNDNAGAQQTVPAPAVAGVAGQVTSIVVDVQDANHHLKEAQDALKHTNFGMADTTLAAIQGDIHTVAYAGDLPLTRVRENLVLAKKRAQANDQAGAKNALQAASDSLNSYASLPNNPHAQDARVLKQQVDSAMSNLGSASVDQIDSWWNQTTQWINTQPDKRQKS